MSKEVKLTGLCIVPGWGMGNAYFVGRGEQQTSVVSISRQDVGDQIMLFNEVRERARQEYRKLTVSFDATPAADSTILNIYEHILDDPAFIGQVVETISTKLYDLETSVRLVSNEFIKRFNAAGTPYFRERAGDMVEICEKIVSCLHQDNGRTKTFMQPVILVVLRTFTPSDILSYDKSKIQGIICSSGGKTSHAAILARSYNIPVVSNIAGLMQNMHPGDPVVMDAERGTVYVRPAGAILNRFEKQKDQVELYDSLRMKWNRPVYTLDGMKVSVLANVSLVDDADDAVNYGADGIGLVRTEYLLSNRKTMPSEEVQFEYYKQIMEKGGDKKPCVLRLMDIGGDKSAAFFDMPSEFNPFMGWRAIRIFLERKDIFETQVTAIIKAGQGRDYSIMIPMVTTLQEWQEAKRFIETVAANLGMPVPKCGVLFEVPLAILEMNSFMKEIDFASIGTNDLIQYLSAADRNNSKVNYLYNPVEPAFLRIIKNAIETANYHGKTVSICGEMAGNPHYTVLLIGLGLKRFSVIPRNIPIVKEIISQISYAEAAEATSHLHAIESTEEAMKWLRSVNKRMVGDTLQKFLNVKDV